MQRAGWCFRWKSSVGRTSPAGPALCLKHGLRDLTEKGGKNKTKSETSQQTLKSTAWINLKPFRWSNETLFLPILAALSEKRVPYMLLANKKAPSSSTSRSMVAVCACSVLFMSFHDSRASGRSRLFTVCTTAWNMGHLLPCSTLLLLLPITSNVAIYRKKINLTWQYIYYLNLNASTVSLCNIIQGKTDSIKCMHFLIIYIKNPWKFVNLEQFIKKAA